MIINTFFIQKGLEDHITNIVLENGEYFVKYYHNKNLKETFEIHVDKQRNILFIENFAQNIIKIKSGS